MKPTLISAAFFLVAACGGSSSGKDESSLQQELESIRARHDLPALTAMLIVGDRIVESGTVGIRAAGQVQTASNGDRWHIGSMTKSMTATLAARLVEQGAIGWDTTIATVFPGMVGTIQAAYQDIRLDELLYHTSGLSDDIATPIFGTLNTNSDALPVQRENWAEELLSVAPATVRGSYLYSNAGYIVAGAMLEEVTGIAWETLMQQEIFMPLGMISSGFGPPGTPGIADQPRGHLPQGGNWLALDPGLPGADNPAALGPAGTVHTTLEDFARYAVAHLEGTNGVSTFLANATFARLHTPAPGTTSTLGWNRFSRGWANGDVLQHNGSNTLWFAVVWLAPGRNLALVAITNAAGTTQGSGGTDEAVTLLLNRYLARQ